VETWSSAESLIVCAAEISRALHSEFVSTKSDRSRGNQTEIDSSSRHQLWVGGNFLRI